MQHVQSCTDPFFEHASKHPALACILTSTTTCRPPDAIQGFEPPPDAEEARRKAERAERRRRALEESDGKDIAAEDTKADEVRAAVCMSSGELL